MCHRVRCNKCQKITYRGCGKHADEVLKNVPIKYLCKCGKIVYLIKKRQREVNSKKINKSKSKKE